MAARGGRVACPTRGGGTSGCYATSGRGGAPTLVAPSAYTWSLARVPTTPAGPSNAGCRGATRHPSGPIPRERRVSANNSVGGGPERAPFITVTTTLAPAYAGGDKRLQPSTAPLGPGDAAYVRGDTGSDNGSRGTRGSGAATRPKGGAPAAHAAPAVSLQPLRGGLAAHSTAAIALTLDVIGRRSEGHLRRGQERIRRAYWAVVVGASAVATIERGGRKSPGTLKLYQVPGVALCVTSGAQWERSELALMKGDTFFTEGVLVDTSNAGPVPVGSGPEHYPSHGRRSPTIAPPSACEGAGGRRLRPAKGGGAGGWPPRAATWGEATTTSRRGEKPSARGTTTRTAA